AARLVDAGQRLERALTAQPGAQAIVTHGAVEIAELLLTQVGRASVQRRRRGSVAGLRPAAGLLLPERGDLVEQSSLFEQQRQARDRRRRDLVARILGENPAQKLDGALAVTEPIRAQARRLPPEGAAALLLEGQLGAPQQELHHLLVPAALEQPLTELLDRPERRARRRLRCLAGRALPFLDRQLEQPL